MPIPNLIHPVDVKIQKVNTGSTMMDDDYREPVQQSRRETTIIIKGQVKWGMDDNLRMRPGGAAEESDGYVLFRYVDLAEASTAIERNDRFIEIDGIETDVYVTKLKPMGHYPNHGATLVRAYFLDRQPGRQGLGV